MSEFDHRQIPNRLIASVPIHFGAHKAILFAGDSVDLSLGGLYLKTELPLDQGEHISLTMNLPTLNDSVLCEGRVAWVNPCLASSKPHFPSGVGIEFVHLTANVEEEIKRFINSRTPRESTQIVKKYKRIAFNEGKCDLHSSCFLLLKIQREIL